MYKLIEGDDSKINEEEEVVGDPWTILPVKTRKYAKECIEIVLSKRHITKLIKFNDFENLEALWLTNNNLTEIKGLETNFRIKILYLGYNRITSLEGSSLSVMKFLDTLYLNNNKLKNLDKVITYLSQFKFLKNLNLFGNPVAEEPEYRPRVIDSLKSLELFDRHMISTIERIKAEKIVKEFNDPLSKKHVKRPKKLKVYENFSSIEKSLFNEANQILNKRKKNEEIRQNILKEQIEREKYPENYIPYNKIMDENMKKYYNTKQFVCTELEGNDMNRLFNRYDSTNTGIFRKDDIQMIFFDIKDLLLQKGIEINENKLINFMLDFYSQAEDFVTKNDIKNCYNKILHQYKANMLNDKILVTDLDYIKGIAYGKEEIEKTGETDSNKKDEKAPRNDIFYIKTTSEKKGRTLILNENKLAKLYQ